MSTTQHRPVVTELRLSAFKTHRGATFGLGPLTLLTGSSGTGKSSVLEGLTALGRLACGAGLHEVFETSVRGGAAACVPQGAQPDVQGRRGFRIGCTVTGPIGPVRLDIAVQAEPTLRIVGERLTGAGETLLTTALRDPARSTVQAAWHTAGAVAVTRAPLPDDLLATAMLPLRVAGRTDGQRLVLAAAEQVVVALRGVFPVAPRPELMRAPVALGDGRLRTACDNLSAVLARTEGECVTRHAALVNAVRAVCSPPVEGLTTLPAPLPGGNRGPAAGGTPTAGGTLTAEAATAVGATIAAVDRGPLGLVPIDRLGDGELRFLALALVLLTGPGVLDVDTSTELLPAGQVLTVLADGLDLGLDRRQAGELLRLAGLAAARGHIRLLGTVQDASFLDGLGGVSVTTLGAGPAQDREPAPCAGPCADPDTARGTDRRTAGPDAAEAESAAGADGDLGDGVDQSG
ncbi:AAA family ATPase [Actinacidiphila sp. ITFR-21]|uniref:AAA family ATPase n=1 Tax=Actinacidiphila sp. ITFR-21 TaxID=3075199 RepID=UPI00288C08A3|nr:ATP-binding protein [Streptomyces sp. ITFR-21]WNI18450.1 ATP-binding protein [Streptomyces sp. ITFR-21]